MIRLVLENGLQPRVVTNHRSLVDGEHSRQFIIGPRRLRTQSRSDEAFDERFDLLSFFADRLKVYLRDQGARHDLIDAVLRAVAGQDDLLMIVRRVEALGRFLDTEDGKNLLAGYRRAANILRIEEKKDGRAFDGAPDSRSSTRRARSRRRRSSSRSTQARERGARRRWRRRISRAPCARCRGCARRSTPSSTRSRSTPTIPRCARTA